MRQTREGDGRMKLRVLWKDERGDAVVEATILFPIIMMIFAGLMLLAMYLPTRALLQRATQYTATALATERSDTWLRCNPETGDYYWVRDKRELGTVYGAALGALKGNNRDEADHAEQLVTVMESKGVVITGNDLEVNYGVINYVVYREIIVTATKHIKLPVDLSFVGLQNEIPITVTSTAVVQNGDEFVRDIDLAADIAKDIGEKHNLDETLLGKIGIFLGKFNELLGI